MENPDTKRQSSAGDLFPILMVNCVMWAIAIVVSLVVLHGTRYYVRLYPVLAGGACVAIVAVSIAWRHRRKAAGSQTVQADSKP